LIPELSKEGIHIFRTSPRANAWVTTPSIAHKGNENEDISRLLFEKFVKKYKAFLMIPESTNIYGYFFVFYEKIT